MTIFAEIEDSEIQELCTFKYIAIEQDGLYTFNAFRYIYNGKIYYARSE